VPEIYQPLSLDACLDTRRCEARALLVEPSAVTQGRGPRGLPARPASALLLVGPEGGWSMEEIRAAAEAGCTAVTLGARTLRADAAPLVALSVLLAYWGEMPGFGIRDPGLGTRG